jgi:zeaxanthin glucosyltransferase
MIFNTLCPSYSLHIQFSSNSSRRGDEQMAHIAFVVVPYLGHVNPMAALARTLAARGHRITFLHMIDVGALLEQAGALSDNRAIAFLPIGQASHPPGRLKAIWIRQQNVRGILRSARVLPDAAGITNMLCRELPAALRRIDPDLIVSDQFEPAGGLVAEHLQLPFVSVACALLANWEQDLPPIWTSWTYTGGKWARWRNIAAFEVTEFAMRPLIRVLRRHAAAFGLPPPSHIRRYFSRLAQISQITPGFDFPRSSKPAVLHYCGPLRQPEQGGAARGCSTTEQGIIFGSLGTLLGSNFRLLSRIADAIRSSGHRGLIAHGGGLDAEQASRLAVPAVDFAPQQQVLKSARLAILHGGLNTVLDALAAGVPVIVIPLAFEQFGIAARVVAAGAGVRLSWRLLSARKIARAIDHVLSNKSYSDAAERLQREIAELGGAAKAADIIERVVESHCRPSLTGQSPS